MIYDLQKPTVWKRLSAWMFDFIIFAILVTGFATIISTAVNYSQKYDELQSYYSKYYEDFGIEDITEEKYKKFTQTEKDEYNKTLEKINELIKNDKRIGEASGLVFNLTLIIAAFGILFAVIVWEFVVPLFLKNGQTVGKKIFGIAVMRTNGVKVSPIQLFVRSVLGKYTFEIMLPVFSIILVFFGGAGVFGILMLGIVLIAQIVSLISTRKTRSALHDLLSDTVTVDLASQLIFDSEEELIKYKEEQHAIMAERSPY